MSVLAIDAGTTGVTVVVVTDDGGIAAKGYQEFRQHFPKPGWVEHAPEEIWQATLEAAREAIAQVDASELKAVGITNQRETILLWDRETLGSPRRAIVWQDRRTAEICTRLKDAGHEERVAELTGLRLDPYFSGTKLMWLAEEEPHTWALVESGRYAVGTVDSYLIARLTRGTYHVTDVSNASRTLLFDLNTGDWSDELCELFGVPRDALPELVPNWGEVATTDPTSFLDLSLPIAGIAGDQQSALFGQTCFDPGDAKCTYGTGSFILTNTGTNLERSDAGLLSTAAWRSPSGELTYALEGAIFVTGAAVQWLRDGLQIVGSAAETEAIAATVDDTEGVVFVPALTGLGAPHWDPHARGLIIGITRGTTRGARRPRHARGDRLRGPGRARDDAQPRCHPPRRRRRVGQRPALPAPGRPARRRGAAAEARRDDGARGGVPRRARHRCLVVDRRAPGDLAARPGLHPRLRPDPRRRRPCPVDRRRRAFQGLGGRVVLPAPTARLRFREMTDDDLDEMTAVLGAPDPARPTRRLRTRADAERWIAWNIQNYAEHGHGLWAVETHDGEFVGDCGLTIQDVEGEPFVEVGYHVKLELRSQGLATEAAAAVRDAASDAGIQHLVAIIRPENTPSQRVAQKIGLTWQRTVFKNGGDALIFGADLATDEFGPASWSSRP